MFQAEGRAQAESGVVWGGVGGMVQQDQESVNELESKVRLEKGMGDTGSEADRRCGAGGGGLLLRKPRSQTAWSFSQLAAAKVSQLGVWWGESKPLGAELVLG